MNELNLAPWEVSSDSVERSGKSQVDMVVEWNGKQSNIEMRWAEVGAPYPIAFAREVGTTSEANWVVFDVECSTLKIADVGFDADVEELKEVANEISSGENSLGRLIISGIEFAKRGNIAAVPIVLSSPKGGFVIHGRNRRSAAFSLNIPVSDEDFNKGNAEMKEAVLSECMAEGSDLYFASLWVCINGQSQLDRLVGTQIRKEVEEIMHSALICENHIWRLDNKWEWNSAFIESGSLAAPDSSRSSNIENVEGQLLLPTVEKCLADYLAQKSASVRTQHLCANASWIEGDVNLEVTANEPTNHEKAEAMLKLRHWLSSRLPEAKVNALLSPPDLY